MIVWQCIMNLIIVIWIIWSYDELTRFDCWIFCFRYHDMLSKTVLWRRQWLESKSQDRFNVDEDFADTIFIINVKRTKKLIVGCKHSPAIGIDNNINEIINIFSILWSYLFLHVWPDTEWFTTTEIDRVVEISSLTLSERKYFLLRCSRLEQVSTPI